MRVNGEEKEERKLSETSAAAAVLLFASENRLTGNEILV
jgi:hypothetical protein